MSNVTMEVLRLNDLKKLPDLLDTTGKLNLFSFADYQDMDRTALRMFCHVHGRYTLPTIELVEYLRKYIGHRSAIEIGAGAGDLGCRLGIPMTDNYMQTWPDVRMMYAATGQPTIKYGKDVENLDALAAVKKYQPEVVIASWVTHWIDPNLPPQPGNMYGIKEDLLLKSVGEYLVIGSQAIHDIKPIMKKKHTTVDASGFVVSRSKRGDDKIWVWPGEKS